MVDNRLRLTKAELEMIGKRYPDIPLDHLMYLAEGMSSLTYLDMLLSSLRYDLEHEGFRDDGEAAQTARSVITKADYYKKHNGRNYVEGFDPELYAGKADRLCEKALGCRIDDLYRIDQLINYTRPIRNRFRSEKDLKKIAVYLGSKLGEIMLEKGLLEKGFDWNFPKKGSNPCICSPDLDLYCDPMAFVHRKLSYDSSAEDMEGTAEDFCYNFIDRTNE